MVDKSRTGRLPVSYTHLDVYKRQAEADRRNRAGTVRKPDPAGRKTDRCRDPCAC